MPWLFVHCAAMNTGVHVSFWITVLSGYLTRSGIAGSFGNSIFSFMRNLHTFPIVAAPTYKLQDSNLVLTAGTAQRRQACDQAAIKGWHRSGSKKSSVLVPTGAGWEMLVPCYWDRRKRVVGRVMARRGPFPNLQNLWYLIRQKGLSRCD